MKKKEEQATTSKDIVKYNNALNTWIFNGFTTTDFDFLMTICAHVKEQKKDPVPIDFSEIRKATHYTGNSEKRFVETLDQMDKKLLQVTVSYNHGAKLTRFSLFRKFTIDRKEKTLTVTVEDEFLDIFNNLVANFTRFELEEFVSLKSKYAKTLFRLLKQFKSTGLYKTSAAELREKMMCPDSYTNGDFIKLVVKASVKDLRPFFGHLNVDIEYEKKRGKPLKGFTFHFDPEPVTAAEEQKLTAEEPKKLTAEEPKKTAAQRSGAAKGAKTKRVKSKNSFNNYEQHVYDFDAIEKMCQKS